MADSRIPLVGGVLLAGMAGLCVRSSLQSWGVPIPNPLSNVPHVEPLISLGLAVASGYVGYRLITDSSRK